MVGKAIVAAALLLASPAAAQTIALQPGESLLEVQAEGQARFLPDAAFLEVGVVSTGPTAREATEANARQMAAVVAAIRQAGVPDRFVRTQQINVQPRFARSSPQDYEGQAQIAGYVARNGVAVTVTRVATAGEVIAAAFAAGANSVSGPNLGTLDPTRGLADARADAIAQARAEAEAYAKGLGMRVARVLRVSERGNFARQPDYVTVSGSRVARPSLSGEPPPPPPSAAPPPPVAGGEMQRTATVWIDYALVPAN